MAFSARAKKIVAGFADEPKLGDIKKSGKEIQLGKKVGLFKNEPVAKNCTPSYLPEFMRIEVAERK